MKHGNLWGLGSQWCNRLPPERGIREAPVFGGSRFSVTEAL
jgi:hypothetical protein